MIQQLFKAQQRIPVCKIFFAFITLAVVSAMTVLASPSLRAAAEGHRFGLVLSGGGARGLAQIGVLKALEENNLKPNFIVATSMGAIVGALYSCGYPADSIAAFAKDVNWTDIFSNNSQRNQLMVSQKDEPAAHLLELRVDNILRPSLPRSVSFGQQFHDYLVRRITPAQYLANSNFDSLPIALRIIATNIVNGDMVVFSRGNLISAIRASCSAPLAFSPVSIDSMLLMDGGLTANIPVEIAVKEQCRYILAVDVTSPMWQQEDINNPIRLVDQIIAIGISRNKKSELQLAHRVVTPDLHKTLNTDFNRIDSLVAWGYRAAIQQIPLIRQELADHNGAAREPSQPVLEPLSAIRLPVFASHNPILQTAADSLVRKASETGARPEADTVAAILRRQFSSPFLSITGQWPGDTGTPLRINQGQINSICITGNKTTSSQMLIRASGLAPNMILTPALLQEAVTSLYSMGLFNTVNASLDSANAVVLHVEEKEQFRIRLGARFDEFHLGEGFIEPAFENLFGLGIVSLLHVQYGLRRERYALELQANHLITSRWVNTLLLQGYFTREQIVSRIEVTDSTDSTDSRAHIRYSETSLRKAGVRVLAGTQIGKFMMFNCGVKLERFKTYSSDDGVFEKLPGSFMQGIQYVMANLTVDDLDRFVFPTRGQQHHITVGAARDAFEGTASFFKVDGSFKAITTFGGRHTLTPQIQAGWASHTVPDVERFFLGGAVAEERYSELSVYNYLSFLGLRPRALPGDIMAVAHLSYRFTPVKDLYFSLGVDWGETWEYGKFKPDSLNAGDIITEAPVGIGASIAYNSVIGPLRVAWGRLVNPPRNHQDVPVEHVFYFSAGRDF